MAPRSMRDSSPPPLGPGGPGLRGRIGDRSRDTFIQPMSMAGNDYVSPLDPSFNYTEGNK